ncbi:hypothetical protein [Niallia sp. 03133]|uniref:hypothetical protein n=1 Tax=Niallia sp. 03133 TaxID=3458060 RepID=UPI0040441DEE
MKIYTAILLQLILWSGYSVIEWLSKHDLVIYKILMFGVFLYLAVTVGNYIIKSPRKTMFATFVSLAIYGSFQMIMNIMTYT